jgi:hypothetical protein
MADILDKLRGGDRRSIGRAEEVVDEVLADLAQFGAVFDGLFDADPVVRMRAADVVEKVTAREPAWLQPYKTVLLDEVAASEQQEVRWHLAQMLPRLEMTAGEQSRAAEILFGYLDDESKIVQTFALQALADLAEEDASLRPRVWAAVERASGEGSPAVRNRAAKLRQRLQDLM